MASPTDHGASADTPAVSVILPVFNAGRFLHTAVLSIVQQTFLSWELLIIDDGSTDNALESIADIEDPRIRIIRDGLNKGLAARLNEGIDLARGEYFARMDQDDIAYPERFARQVETLNYDASLDLVATRCMTISQQNEPVGLLPYAESHEDICARPWRGFYMPHPTWMGRTEWFRKYRYTIPELHLCEDQDLLTRSYGESRFGVVPEILFAYRIRRRNNLKRRLATRIAVIGMQVRNFASLHRKRMLLLSIMAFIARVAMDLLNALMPLRFQAGAHREKRIGKVDIERFQKLLRSLGIRSDVVR